MSLYGNPFGNSYWQWCAPTQPQWWVQMQATPLKPAPPPKRRSTDKRTHKELVEEVKKLQVLATSLSTRVENLEAAKQDLLRRKPRFGWRR